MSMSTPALSAGTPAALPAEDKPFVPPRLRWLRKHPTLFIGALLLPCARFHSRVLIQSSGATSGPAAGSSSAVC